jgi:hypothetical protein
MAEQRRARANVCTLDDMHRMPELDRWRMRQWLDTVLSRTPYTRSQVDTIIAVDDERVTFDMWNGHQHHLVTVDNILPPPHWPTEGR